MVITDESRRRNGASLCDFSMQEDSLSPGNTPAVIGSPNHSQLTTGEKFQTFWSPRRTIPIRTIKQDPQNPKRILPYILGVLSLILIALRLASSNPISRFPQNFHFQNFVRLKSQKPIGTKIPFPVILKKPITKAVNSYLIGYRPDDSEQGPLEAICALPDGWEPITPCRKFHEVNQIILASPTYYLLGFSFNYSSNPVNSDIASFSPFQIRQKVSQPLVKIPTVAEITCTVGGRRIASTRKRKENYNCCQYYSPIPEMIVGNSHQFDHTIIYFGKTTTWSHLLSNVPNIITSISYSKLSDPFFSVALATNPYWKTKLVIDYPDTCESTITPILGLTKIWSPLYIITSRRPIQVFGYTTPTNILRLPPMINLCIMERSHSTIMRRKAFLALNRNLQQFAYSANLPGKHVIILNHRPSDDYNFWRC